MKKIEMIQEEIKKITSEIRAELEKEYSSRFDNNGDFAEIFEDILVEEYRKNEKYNKLQMELTKLAPKEEVTVEEILTDLFPA